MIPRVLVTGAGSASAMASLEVLAGGDLSVFAADMDRYAPGLFLVPADHRCSLPPADEPSYLSALFALALRHRIDVIVPGSVAELPALAHAREVFEAAGVALALARPRLLALADDKLALAQAVEGVVPTPRSWTSADILAGADPRLPLRVLSPHGAWNGGRGIVLSREELLAAARADDVLFQEVLIGAEFAVDLLLGRDGRLRALVPREMARGQGPLALTERTLHDPAVERAAARVAAHLGTMPFATLHFQKGADQRPRLLDLDVLPSSGAALVRAAGVDLPRMIVLDAMTLDAGALDSATLDLTPLAEAAEADATAVGPLPFRELGAVRTGAQHFVPAAEIRAAEREPWESLGPIRAGRLLH